MRRDRTPERHDYKPTADERCSEWNAHCSCGWTSPNNPFRNKMAPLRAWEDHCAEAEEAGE